MISNDFMLAVTRLRSRNAFNPYTDRCAVHDAPDAPALRRQNLQLVLNAAISAGVESIWIGRDLGYRGGRRTGLALTDEAHLEAHSDLYGRLPLAKATRSPVVAERTARVVWDVLGEIRKPIFLWNVFPLHPYEPGDPMSNRAHTRAERQSASHLIAWLIETLRPRTIVAIGRDAASALEEGGIQPLAVRHPSYGGQREFTDGIANAYGIVVRKTCPVAPMML